MIHQLLLGRAFVLSGNECVLQSQTGFFLLVYKQYDPIDHVYLGHSAGAIIQSDKYICQKTEKQQYINLGTVKIIIETSAKHLQWLG